MPGVINVNILLPNFLNIWPYNTELFFHADLSTKLLMSNKLVKKSKRSIFFVIANGLQQQETLVQWEVHVANVRDILQKHKAARNLLQSAMYTQIDGMNGHV